MRRVLLLTILFTQLALGTALAQQNQGPQQFSPEQFEKELHQFITKEACLTPQEAAKFFPIYREMQKKQRALYGRQQQLGRIKPTDEKGCEKAIRQRDEIELELKRIQQIYHDRLLSVVPASKLYDAIKAEDRFHRQKLRNWGQSMQGMQGMRRFQGSPGAPNFGNPGNFGYPGNRFNGNRNPGNRNQGNKKQ